MTTPDPHDTSVDYERLEKELLAQNRDAAGVDTQDPEEYVLIHKLNGPRSTQRHS